MPATSFFSRALPLSLYPGTDKIGPFGCLGFVGRGFESFGVSLTCPTMMIISEVVRKMQEGSADTGSRGHWKINYNNHRDFGLILGESSSLKQADGIAMHYQPRGSSKALRMGQVFSLEWGCRDLVSVPQMLKAHSPSGPLHCPSLCWNVLLPGPRGWLLLHPDQHFLLILVCLSSVVECQLHEDKALVHLVSFCTPVLEIVLWHMGEAPRVFRDKCVAQVS